ncbi:PREDICTED: protein trichome berefringence-like 7 [Ipomoea nil]|uniref:protein trichome berefringence-like 7 n=1 Tax=Ipomoea nil TaxID=35883 RepID=UPI000901A182|nr:PREDICTED: protein trichome berefringence-like 7 [Ipomoea nil]XP_019196750.1 PREDICTED: protein trichome berefringence-like 7 [Ipomoea nil]XP_019196751.1 PREDICTED: protein trichome berefringence-like 7 [Ipomoea nil]
MDWGFFEHLKPASLKHFNFGKLMTWKSCKSWGFQSFNLIVLVGSFFLFVVVIGSWFLSNLESLQPVVVLGNGNNEPSFSNSECNLFDGMWVPEESYPLYNASECPFAEGGFDCLSNGREDNGYLKWRWKPKNCKIPRFDVGMILEKLRGKRVVFVGDSLSRTQWESMICMLMTGVEDKKSVYEVNGNQITKQIGYLGVRFSSFDFTVEFYRSVFLVQPGRAPKGAPKRVKSSLKLDKMDDMSKEWVDSDILIFNTGHWWTPTKLFEMGCYFQISGRMKLGMSINNAFRKALSTWQSWVENEVNPKRTRVFFRTFESTHWSSGIRQNCNVTQQPWSETRGREKSIFSDIIMNAVNNLSVPVTPLDVSFMGAFRADAHVGTWSDNPKVPDCSHWCLPGVPDEWNELLFAFLFSEQ